MDRDSDDDVAVTEVWIFQVMPSKGPEYSARYLPHVPGLEYWNRFERFVFKGEPLVIKTRGDLRAFVRILGYEL